MNRAVFTSYFSVKAVTVNDNFWSPFMERIRKQVIPYQWKALNDEVPGAVPSYCMRNFKLAAELTHPELDYGVDRNVGHGGFVFQDSDFAKWLEALSYSLMWHPDSAWEKIADDAIDIVCNAQQDDGYLHTYYIINGLEKRFTNLMDHHELYCLGHFIEGATAYYEATGKKKMLDVLLKYIECVDRHLGLEEGKLHGYCGCEMIELALAKLYKVTKDEKHLRLAKYFIDQRGQQPLYFEEEIKRNGNKWHWSDGYFQFQYYQAGKPVRDQHIAEGHAVRGPYLYCGMADVAKLTGDETLLKACEDIFSNIVNRQMYITGAIGQSEYGESFTFDYDLPNDTVYAETCAQISLAFFAKRLSSIEPKGVYADTIERTLYNSIISGMSLDGEHFFYVNPLEVIPEASEKSRIYKHVVIERPKWLGCACCPPNLARIVASLGSYAYSSNEGSVYTHLYLGSEAAFNIVGKKIKIKQETNYPWEGQVQISFELTDSANFKYAFRVPKWCKKFSVLLNGGRAEYSTVDGYAVIDREWKNGDTIKIDFDMPVMVIESNPKVRENIGKAAVMRGPVVYCLEEADNGKELFKTRLPGDPQFQFRHDKDLLKGIVTITSAGKKLKDWKGDTLYASAEAGVYDDINLRWIPYYAWANRGPGEMTVWVHRE